jgi:uncharacterized protein DUF4386
MSTAIAIDGIKETSPRAKARLTGVFYLVTILAGIFAQGFVSERLVASGDAARTATNILTHEPLYRLAFTVYLIEMASQITMTALFYDLLKPVSRSVSGLSAVFSYIGCGIKTLSRLFYFAPLLVLGGAPYLSVFSADQQQALALLFLKVNDQGAAIALVFFGFSTVLKGYLVFRSTFLPRALGVLTTVGGLGWLAFLSPPLGYRLFPYIVGVALLGSVATIVWLLVVGVNEKRWREQASASAASIWR